jgi:hypothetical protein
METTVIEWSPPSRYADYPNVVELMRSVRNWQLEHGLQPDGILGPHTWAKRDAQIERLARKLMAALELAGLKYTQLHSMLSWLNPPVRSWWSMYRYGFWIAYFLFFGGLIALVMMAPGVLR